MTLPRQPERTVTGQTPEADRSDPGEPVPHTFADIVEPRPKALTSLADDVELIAACRRGEARAMELLYHQYKRRVFGIIHRIVGSSDAEEVAQEVFVRIFRALGSFRGESALSTWIYRLTVNAALSYVAKRSRRNEVGDEALGQLPAEAAPQTDPGLRTRIEAALGQLPAGYRAILVLHDVEGLSHEECAAILECRIGTCKSQLHKARARMREILSKHGAGMGNGGSGNGGKEPA